jgi:mono/diheme cytochrome c family protein
VRKIITGILAVAFIGVLSTVAWKACATEDPATTEEPAKTDDNGSADATPPPADAAAGGECCKAGDTTPPLDLIKATPKGGLHNPYNDQIAAIADAGHKKYLSFSCNGCHGGGGGGGMCVPLTNDTFVYGADDDTLFRLIALGSDDLKKQGYVRKGQETVVGPMPPFGGIIKTSDDLWKVLAWMRSVNPRSLEKADKPVQ